MARPKLVKIERRTHKLDDSDVRNLQCMLSHANDASECEIACVAWAHGAGLIDDSELATFNVDLRWRMNDGALGRSYVRMSSGEKLAQLAESTK